MPCQKINYQCSDVKNKINPALVPVFFFRFPIPSRPPPSLLGHFPEISHGFAVLLTGSWWPGTTITTDIHGSDRNDHQCNDSQWCYSQYFRSEISWKSVGVYGLLGCDNFSSSQFCDGNQTLCDVDVCPGDRSSLVWLWARLMRTQLVTNFVFHQIVTQTCPLLPQLGSFV